MRERRREEDLRIGIFVEDGMRGVIHVGVNRQITHLLVDHGLHAKLPFLASFIRMNNILGSRSRKPRNKGNGLRFRRIPVTPTNALEPDTVHHTLPMPLINKRMFSLTLKQPPPLKTSPTQYPNSRYGSLLRRRISVPSSLSICLTLPSVCLSHLVACTQLVSTTI
ncbi:uncharacterized protein K444DRAFT_29671 [Hyaloscypha bicolor E]|uniref:Uncharacterized protein n=1 Tax=Hyaloscypha bicolor E TaxID=1095630 RepID=A0A2J6T3G3_9HELO|nr:uncharacterized protein K444DRAFT_29671 [Hyaloscypha bicolor E]PMD57539.1 hypothetical protein K444DRAFT_29671 [Hyaloscypha bicolor E]